MTSAWRRLGKLSVLCSLKRRRSGGWRRGGGCRLLAAGVHQVFQLLAWLEERDFLSRDFHPIAGLRITSDARLTLAGTKTAESSDFYLVADSQGAHDAVKDGFDD